LALWGRTGILVFAVTLLVAAAFWAGRSYEAAQQKTVGEATFEAPQGVRQATADEAKPKTAEQGKGGASDTIDIDPNNPVSPEEQSEFSRLDCKAYKVVQAEGQEAVNNYFQEAINRGTTLAVVLSEHGYECTNLEIRDLQEQEKQAAAK
jgi:hypothetical protein